MGHHPFSVRHRTAATLVSSGSKPASSRAVRPFNLAEMGKGGFGDLAACRVSPAASVPFLRATRITAVKIAIP